MKLFQGLLRLKLGGLKEGMMTLIIDIAKRIIEKNSYYSFLSSLNVFSQKILYTKLTNNKSAVSDRIINEIKFVLEPEFDALKWDYDFGGKGIKDIFKLNSLPKKLERKKREIILLFDIAKFVAS